MHSGSLPVHPHRRRPLNEADDRRRPLAEADDHRAPCRAGSMRVTNASSSRTPTQGNDPGLDHPSGADGLLGRS